MKYWAILLAPLLFLSLADAKIPKYVSLDEPFPVYQAIAVKNHLKRVETVGGFLRWLEKGYPKAEVNRLKQWISKMDVPEDQYFPAYKTKGNTIYYGRHRMSFYDDYIVINKKKYKMQKGLPIAKFAEQVCKDLKCGSYKSANNFDSLVFGEAHAIADWLLYGLIFTGGFIVGRWVWPWVISRRQGPTIVEETVYTEQVFAQNEIAEGAAQGGTPKCENGRLVIEGSKRGIFGRRGETIAVPNLQDDRITCEQNVEMIKAAANKNTPQVTAGEGQRSSSGFMSAPPKKKLKPWQKRHQWH